MSDAEKLTQNQPAEIHVDGIPVYVGEISEILAQGLLMSETLAPGGTEDSDSISIHPGAPGDLVFKELFDEDDNPVIVPMTLVSASGTDLTLDFFDQASEATTTALKLLTAKKKPPAQASAAADVLPELRKRSLRQLNKVLINFLSSLIDHLFDLSSRPQNKDQQEALYEAMNIFKAAQEPISEAFDEKIDSYFEDLVKQFDESAEEDTEAAPTELNLVDLQDFEDSLSLDRMIKMGQEKHAPPLECLVLRFADLVGQKPLDTRLPMDVAQICESFQ